jgi:hypothetical protein
MRSDETPGEQGEPEGLAERHAALNADRAALEAQRGYRERTVGATGTWVSYAFAAVMLVLSVGLALLAANDVIPRNAQGVFIPMVLLGVFGIGLVFILRWQHVGGRSTAGEAQAGEVHASLPLAPPIAADLQLEERRVRLARCAEPRILYAQMAARGIHLNEMFWGAVFLGPLIVGVCGFSVDAAFGGTGLKAGDGWALAGCFAVIVAGVTFVAWFRRRRLARISRRLQALDALGSRVFGASLLDYQGAMAWLNSHWAAESNPDDMYASHAELALSGTLHRYPVMLDLEPAGISQEDVSYPPRALAYVAALVPAGFARSPAAGELRALLGSQGFELECLDHAGFIARATDIGRPPLIADPPVLDRLWGVTDALVAVASRSRVSPPPGP